MNTKTQVNYTHGSSEHGSSTSDTSLLRVLPSFLHSCAGSILLLYALSHLSFLTLPDRNHQLRSTVFPFLTNWHLYLCAAFLEIATAILCFKWRGTGITNAVILTFVAVMLWYRWAFYYTGGNYCGCLGLLGKLLHVTKTQEKAIPIATLICLVLTTIPWFCQRACNILSRLIYCVGIIMLLQFQHAALADPSIEVHGYVDSSLCNPDTGSAYSQWQWHSIFTAIIADNTWRISVTNLEINTWWEIRFYDGTNSYVLEPVGSNFNTSATNLPSSDRFVATISPSGVCIPLNADPLGAGLVSVTYGIRPDLCKTNQFGSVEMPVPWTLGQENPGAWGYKWIFELSDDGRFFKDVQIIRDKRLDRSEQKELFRRELDYPESLGTYNMYILRLQERKSIQSGWVGARYECSQWLHTNGMTIPMASTLKSYMPPPNGPLPSRMFNVRATSIIIHEESKNIFPQIEASTQVMDYRYKKSNAERIFKYAEYMLKRGDPWKSSQDQELLVQAEDWLQHGRKYNDFADRGKKWAALILLVLIVIPAVILWFRTVNKANKMRRKWQL